MRGAVLLLLLCLVRPRSEEHTSELQSQSNLVCRLLLEKKKENLYSRVHSTTTPQLVTTETSNCVPLEGVSSHRRSIWNGNKPTSLTITPATMGDVMRHT